VVESSTLLKCRRGNLTEGSNPSLSASFFKVFKTSDLRSRQTERRARFQNRFQNKSAHIRGCRCCR
jgi:hypothetical protein